MPRPATSAVEVEGLVKRYGATTAVDGASFAVREGTVLALLGPNGAGKTTTVETCEGFRLPDAGTVRVLGRTPWRDRRALAPLVGVMPQSGGVYPGARPGEVLRLYAAFYPDPLDPAALLDRLGVPPRTPYRRLSGGQQQRLSLALAVVGRPRLVFLDEPTAGLDPQARLATWELVRELRSDGVTVVLTTHAMDEAEALADDVVVVDAGRVVASGPLAELTAGGGGLRFRSTAGLDTASLGAAVGRDVTEPTPGSYVVAGAIDPALVAAVTAWCADRGVLAEDVRSGRRTLEDVFLELTGRGLRA
ncbi:MAG TPA: ABC transporter ATP-binding protein [Mycobacteriales bacterium]|nr:ABC transporter ATP-binding protein [Mycobacteriales bacterium]